MTSDRIAILYLIDYFHRSGGTETHLAQLITGLRHSGGLSSREESRRVSRGLAAGALRVLAVGGGPLLEQFQQRLAHTELGSRTVFSGDVADVLPPLWAMDVGCLTPGSNEGFLERYPRADGRRTTHDRD